MVFERHGWSFSRFLKDIGVPADIMDSPDNQITDIQLFDIIHNAVLITGDEFFGLHAGEVFSGLPNILGYLLLNCSTLGEAVQNYCEYQQVYDQSSVITLHVEERLLKIRIEMVNPQYDGDRHLVDLRMAGTLKYYEVLTGKSRSLKEACFRYPKPGDISEYKRVFNCPLRFSHSFNQIVFNEKEMDTPILQPNKDLKVVFEQYTRNVLKQNVKSLSISQKVKNTLAETMNGEVPDIAAISKSLGMGTRNLQLKLKEEGTTFSKLLDEIRKELALEYIKDKEITLAEISYILGFSELSVFHRCFKRWTNSTPGYYRKLSPIYQPDCMAGHPSLD